MSGFGWESIGGGGGGSLPSGFLQVAGGVPLDTTLRTITDGVGNASPLQLSTTQVVAGKVVFTSGVLSRDVNDATGLRLFGGTLITTNDSGYIYLQRDTTNFGAPIFGLANGNFDSNFFRWERNGTEISRLTATGNWYMGVGGVTPSARLHVRGDGTNPIARFENGAGTQVAQMSDNGVLNYFTNNSGIAFYGTGIFFINSGTIHDYTTNGYHRFRNLDSNSNTKIIGIESNCQKIVAGSTTFRPLNIEYTINNSAAQTGTATGIFLNATETNLNGMTHNFMDLQGGDTGGLSVFRVSKNRVSAVRFETIVRLGGGSDTAQHYIYGGEGNSTGIILDRGSSTISVIGVFETRRDTVNYYRSVNNAASVFTDLQFDVRNVYYQFNAGTGMGLGITSGASARLHVKGDGTNPIALFEGPSSSVFLARINDRITSGGSAGLGLGGFELLNGDNTTTVFRLTRSAEAGLVVQSLANIGFSLGNTFSASAYHVNFTRTGGGHILQTLTGTNVTSSWYTGDGSSNTGWIGTESNHSFGILTNNNYKVLISNNTNTLIALGNSFTSGVPAIKRNGTAIEFKLADDSDYCSIFASSVRSSLMQSFSGANNGRVSLQTWNNMIVNVEDDGVCIQSGAFASPNASAILQVNSTTKGFLPPRMTTTERNAIASPASGLIVYDRTLNKLYLFTTAWEEITSA